MDKRMERRINKKLLVSLKEDEFEELGMTSNISLSGMFVASPKIISANKNVSILIAAQNDIFKVKGEVIWNIRSPDKYSVNLPGGMGIRIKEAPETYFAYVENIIYQTPYPPIKITDH